MSIPDIALLISCSRSFATDTGMSYLGLDFSPSVVSIRSENLDTTLTALPADARRPKLGSIRDDFCSLVLLATPIACFSCRNAHLARSTMDPTIFHNDIPRKYPEYARMIDSAKRCISSRAFTSPGGPGSSLASDSDLDPVPFGNQAFSVRKRTSDSCSPQPSLLLGFLMPGRCCFGGGSCR